MPKMTYNVQGEGTTGKALHITIPKEICLRQGIQKHTKMEFKDCQEIDDKGTVVNVIKLYKVEQDAVVPAAPKIEIQKPAVIDDKDVLTIECGRCEGTGNLCNHPNAAETEGESCPDDPERERCIDTCQYMIPCDVCQQGKQEEEEDGK